MEIKEKKNLLEMTKKSSTYKLIITEELEKKFQYYLNRFPTTEFSGTLFYKTTGSFVNNDLVITAIDFLLQDIGSSAYTEFEQSPDVVSYMVEHPELLDEGVYQGLCHSHNSMPSFFSGTDVSTLREEGSDRTHFLSLIINCCKTNPKYEAAITRIIEEEMVATGSVKFKTFNEKEDSNPITYKFTRKRLEYYMLDITKPVIIDEFVELSNRITEVYKQKAEKTKATYKSPVLENYYSGAYRQPEPKYFNTPYQNNFQRTNVGKANIAPVYVPEVESSLPFEEPIAEMDYNKAKINIDIIEDLAAQILTGDINYVKDDKSSLNDLAISSDELFNERFDHINTFKVWAEQFVEFLVYYTEDPSLMTVGDDEIAAYIAYGLQERLENLTTKNDYINCFINILNKYII